MTGFLNQFEYPTRALIYVSLLDYASFSFYFDGDNAIERSLSFQRISALAPVGSLSTEVVEQALNDAVTAFPSLVAGAQGMFAEY